MPFQKGTALLPQRMTNIMLCFFLLDVAHRSGQEKGEPPDAASAISPQVRSAHCASAKPFHGPWLHVIAIDTCSSVAIKSRDFRIGNTLWSDVSFRESRSVCVDDVQAAYVRVPRRTPVTGVFGQSASSWSPPQVVVT
ncbi:hypothetical protein K458DRAFT_385410 [Lentithecium fluviatile CBS 122367]|uniref:Secreted protein n=1 Tax=Lentithecium fluviatile CBS 122367 TaxID=1168545 RepID=A0A6G1JC97_9PLEO|nr:hypothetical protein K458DRAFT_385410 [Lentithecium fluviatile CBS 122367]